MSGATAGRVFRNRYETGFKTAGWCILNQSASEGTAPSRRIPDNRAEQKTKSARRILSGENSVSPGEIRGSFFGL